MRNHQITVLSGTIKTKFKPKSSRKPVFLASLHTHGVTVRQGWPGPEGQLLEDWMGTAERLLPESPGGVGGGGRARHCLGKPSWGTGALREGCAVSTAPVWVHYVQNCLVPPHSLKERSSCDKQSSREHMSEHQGWFAYLNVPYECFSCPKNTHLASSWGPRSCAAMHSHWRRLGS